MTQVWVQGNGDLNIKTAAQAEIAQRATFQNLLNHLKRAVLNNKQHTPVYQKLQKQLNAYLQTAYEKDTADQAAQLSPTS